MVTDKVSPQSPSTNHTPLLIPSRGCGSARAQGAAEKGVRSGDGTPTGHHPTGDGATMPTCFRPQQRPGFDRVFAFRCISAHGSDTKVNKPKAPRCGIRLPVPSDACGEKSKADIVPVFRPPASSSLRSTNREACQNTTPQQRYRLGGLSRWLQLKLPVSSAKTGSGGGSDPRPIHRSHPPTSLTLRTRSSVLGALPAFEHPPTCRATHSRAPSFRETPSFHIGEDARTRARSSPIV